MASGFDHAGRQRLFDEYVGARFQRGDGVPCVAVGIGIDRNELRALRQARFAAFEALIAGEFGRERYRGAVDETDELEAGIAVIREGMTLTHLAQAHDQCANGLHRPNFALRLTAAWRAVPAPAARAMRVRCAYPATRPRAAACRAAAMRRPFAG